MTDATAAQAEASTPSSGHITGFGSKGYRSYVLLMLMLVYTLNFIDRNLMGVLAEPIITTFGLSDGQFGFLAGWPFAIFYAVMGLPIAMGADRYNRVYIITACIVLWSLMTALCGIAAGFFTLMMFRIGVAVGEAGCTPPANSIIGDYYPAKHRATALGVYSMGVTVGAVLAFLFGGPLADMEGATFGAWLNSVGLSGLFSGIDWSTVEGWRIAFVVIGLPGIVVALILMFTVKEPPRGYSDPPNAAKTDRASMKETFKELSRKPSFWWMTLGAALVAFVGYGIFTFQIPFLVREHGLSVREASVNYGAPLAAISALGTFMGGYLTDKMTSRSFTAIAWVPAAGLLLAIPFYIGAFFSSSLVVVFILWAIATACHYAYLGAQYNIGQGVVSARSRATAIAILLIVVSIIGNGIGPQFVGIMSDVFSKGAVANIGVEGLSLAACNAGDGLTETAMAACSSAKSTGLKSAISVTTLWFIVAAACFLMSAKSLRRDYVADIGGTAE
ncbi:MAG: MFS transporter [Hyphomonadaceae bacterium]|nr:MFS transporter [Hyphomonadaceae bacterium]